MARRFAFPHSINVYAVHSRRTACHLVVPESCTHQHAAREALALCAYTLQEASCASRSLLFHSQPFGCCMQVDMDSPVMSSSIIASSARVSDCSGCSSSKHRVESSASSAFNWGVTASSHTCKHAGQSNARVPQRRRCDGERRGPENISQ